MHLSRFRMMIQTASTVGSNGYVGAFVTKAVNSNPLKGVCVPYLNCYACPSALFSCPIGTLQHFMAIRAIPYLLLGILGAVGITIGRMACGWACPFGFLQDLIYKIKSRKYTLPWYMKYFKYGFLLIFALFLPYVTGDTWFSKICPMGTLTAGIPWMAWNPVNPATGLPVLPSPPGWQFAGELVILAGFLGWFVVSRRPFCKAVCPLGAILALFNRFSLVRLEVSENCDGCNFCKEDCPMDLQVPLEINSPECIRCLDCTRCGHVTVRTPFDGKGMTHVEQA
ncbi:MAG: 4Fe-4S binding protein [Desulfovibrionaceae bacterium]|nr:4Fe-4S binding protein [Desulfovibrionaceae bacterium]